MENDAFQKLLVVLNRTDGILGCLAVTPDGSVIASSLPATDDVAMIAALSATLFSNNDVAIQRMTLGNLVQMTLYTDNGILHFCDVDDRILVVLTAKEHHIDLEKLIRPVQD